MANRSRLLLRIAALTGMVLLTLLVSAAPVFGQDSLNMSRLGQVQEWWEYAVDLLVDGNYLYLLTEGPGLVTYDISDPTAPRVVSVAKMGGWQGGIAKEGNYLLTTGVFGGVQLFDVTSPAALVPLLARYAIFGQRTPALAFPYIYIDRFDGFDTYDVSNPSQPSLTNSFRRGGASNFSGIMKYDDILFNWGDQHSLYLLSIQNPAVPSLLPDSIANRFRGCAMGDERLYGVGASTQNNRVFVYDLSDPAHPVLGGSVAISTYYGEISAFGRRAAVVDYNSSSIGIINAENVTDPFYEAVFPASGYSQVAMNDHLVFNANSLAFSVTDISDINNPQSIYTDTLGRISGILGMRGSYVMVEEMHPYHYAVVDVSNTNSPQLVGRVPFRAGAKSVLIGRYLFSAEDGDYLFVYDALDLLAPVLVDSALLSTAQYSNSDIATDGNYLYAKYDSIFYVFEYTPDHVLQSISELSISMDYGELLVDYPIALAGNKIIDISNPIQPILAGVSQLEAGNISDSSASVMANSILYLIRYNGNNIADFSNPYAPQYFYSTWLDSADRIVGGDDRFLYISQYGHNSSRSRVVVLDIQANPHDPQPVAFYPQDTRWAIRHDNTLYACDLYSLNSLSLDNILNPHAVNDMTVMRDGETPNILLRWSPAAGASSYKIYVDSDFNSLGQMNTLLATTSATSYTHVNAVSLPGKRFYLVVASTDTAP